MDSKRIRQHIRYFLGWIGLIVSAFIIKLTPRRGIYRVARAMAWLGFRIAGKQRKIALEGLTIAFGNTKSPAEIRTVAKECFLSMAKSGVEILHYMDYPELIKQQIILKNKENLDNALKQKKGVILVSAHFGNFPLMLARLSLEGYPTSGMMRTMRDYRAEKFFADKRKKLHIKTIYTQPRRACVVSSIQALRNNELLFVLMDQNFGTNGVFVDFFGRKAATATGPVVLAQRTKAMIVPCFIVRQADNTSHLIFERPLQWEEGRDEEDSVIRNVQKLTTIIEEYVRRYPAEWGWIHRRWKTKQSIA